MQDSGPEAWSVTETPRRQSLGLDVWPWIVRQSALYAAISLAVWVAYGLYFLLDPLDHQPDWLGLDWTLTRPLALWFLYLFVLGLPSLVIVFSLSFSGSRRWLGIVMRVGIALLLMALPGLLIFVANEFEQLVFAAIGQAVFALLARRFVYSTGV